MSIGDPLAAQAAALLRDTVSPRVTLYRLALLLETHLTGAAQCAIVLEGEPAPDAAPAGAATLVAPIGDAQGVYGAIHFIGQPGETLPAEAREALDAVASLAASVARAALGLDVPHNWRP